ncbi:hypothetical protein Cylst_0736 [Cylindrospermum stagnale PCC 7417]|uniref:Uncharacterized protein n=1 Tax=Cylindrospermum stagnale PCC 7417 TaxID=56107 RepID=K9WS99_9NOST|nr:hypothetical protein [Cylindrospermum stagnale]AFZ23063.1 hypothetical protein Cylst_0736 [Cylindrospermum stagnale PCC 7417]
MQQLTYRVRLWRKSLLRDNRSHAPVEVRSKCLDLSRIYIADKSKKLAVKVPETVAGAVFLARIIKLDDSQTKYRAD